MSKFVGIKNNKIYVVSDKKFISDNYEVIELPKELENETLNSLILNFKYKNNQFINKDKIKLGKDMKVAFVSNFNQKCGISTYAEKLFPEIIKNIKDFKIFAEYNNYSTNSSNIDSSNIIECWKRGESLQELIKEIKKYDPDIILIQKEFGLFPNARYWMSMITQLSSYRIIATMHSTYHHLDKSIVETCIPEIIVHLNESANILKNEKMISSKIYVIPHGCDNINSEKLWNYYQSNYTIFQYGFLFRYKNFESSIKAISLLKNKYPEKYKDIYLTCVLSESDFCKIEHESYYNDLFNLIQELNICDNVALIRGFQSNKMIQSYLKMNKVAIFPYKSNKDFECYGASGAGRESMSLGLPIISSSVPHFSDLPTIKANNDEQLCLEIDNLFSNQDYYNKQIEIQNKYIQDNSWANVAQKYIDVFENNYNQYE